MPKSRSWKTRVATTVCILGGLLWGASGPAQEDDPHRAADDGPALAAAVAWTDLSPAARRRVEHLYQQLMCDCPRETYSRTLANCPDACANPQKDLIVAMVNEERSDQEVFEAMLQRVGHDQRVLASPRSFFGRWAYVLPFVFLVLGFIMAGVVLRSWRAGGRLDRQRREKTAALVTEEELSRVEKELAELD